MQTRKNVKWKRTKKFEFGDFFSAMQFTNHVAMTAEEMNHHPDIYIQYKRVTISCHTHEKENTITEKDRALAKEIDNWRLEMNE